MILTVVSIEHHHRVRNHFCSFGIQFADDQNTVHSTTASRVGMYQIYFPVFIPKRSRINHSFPRLYQYRFSPFPFRIFCFYQIDAVIRITPINIEFSVMKTDCRCPYSFAMLRFIKELLRFLNRQGVIHKRPVYQIIGVKYRKSRDAVKAGSCHIEVISRRAHIRIGIIGIKNRVLISAVALVSHPGPRNFLCTCHKTASHHSCYKQSLFTHIT